MNDLRGHSRSLPLLPFDRPCNISYWSSIVSISVSCTVFEILTLICQRMKMSRDLDHAHLRDSLSSRDRHFWGQYMHKIWRFYLQPFQRNLRGCKIRKLVTWPWPRPFQGRFVISRLGHDMINLPTKLELPIFTRYGNMKGAAKCWKWGGLGWLGVTQGHWK